MDKTWMKLPWNSKAYLHGLRMFLDFAFSQTNTGEKQMILCPCKKCKNGICLSREEVEVHLKCVGFINGYTQWVAHGEAYNFSTPPSFHNEPSDVNNVQEMLNDAFGVPHDDVEMDGNDDNEIEEPNLEAKSFYKLVDDSQQELWPGCKKFSKLSFLVRLYHIKCLGNISNRIFTMLLELLNEAFPEGVKLPKSNYEARKIIEELGLGYKKYDACPNDCTLFWGKDESRIQCETCSCTRWVVSDGDPTGEKRKVPHKVLRHFPLNGRLQRLFMSLKTASFMRWHAEGRTKDGNMRHPADSPAWQYFDFKNPEFAKDHRNVRLGLASDGFNPFKNMKYQTTGKLSFAEVEEKLKQQLGRSPSRVEMFDACFTDLNGDPPCAEVGAALEEMKEVQSKSPPGSRDSIGPSDSFAKVMGKDPHGRVRMVGLGVNPSDITGGIPSRSACYRMVLENQVAMTRMEEKVDAATKLIANLQEKMQQQN